MISKVLITCWLILTSGLNDIYNFNVPLIEGGNISLSEFSNKRILIITLPLVQNASNDSLLASLDTIAAAHNLTLQVIGVPSIEDGFTAAQKSTLHLWYRSKLDNRIVLTDGLYTRKSSGSQQHPLFNWLTHLEDNNSFDIDVAGPGHKFFIRPGGILYGNLMPHTRMWSEAVIKTIQLP